MILVVEDWKLYGGFMLGVPVAVPDPLFES
jgi:hypothetical protein